MVMNRNDATVELLDLMRHVLPEEGGPYALHEPEIGGAEEGLVLETLREGFVSYAGRHVTLFERQLAEVCGVKAAVAVVSGTAAIHIVLEAYGIGANDEVLCPALTFIASANAISHAGAVAHFVECSEANFGIDAARLDKYLEKIAVKTNGVWCNRATGRRLAAILPVHVFGHIGDIAALRAISAKWNIPIVEDSTEALGSRDEANLLFHSGVASVLSFNGNKIVTTGGGGAVLTDDGDFAKRLKHLTTTAKLPHAWRFDHDEVGYNYRMPNINAALGMAQLDRLDGFVANKRRLADIYRRACAGMQNWRFIEEPAGTQSNYWLNAVMLPSADVTLLDQTLAELHGARYFCRPCWTPMHKLPIYAGNPRDDLPVTEALANRIICLPSSPKLVNVARA